MSNSNFIYQSPLRTHKRLGDVINQYNEYIDSLEKKQGSYHKISTPSGSPGAVIYKPDYEYYHFEVSPDGIKKTELGNVPSELFQKVLTSWAPYQNTNTTNYWMMQLGQTEIAMKKNYQTAVSQSNKTGFICNITSEMDSIIAIKDQALNVYLKNTTPTTTAPAGSSSTISSQVNQIKIFDIFSNATTIQNNLDNCIANRRMTNINLSSSGNMSDASFQMSVPGITINSDGLNAKYTKLFETFSTVPNINSMSSYVCTEITTNIKVESSQYYNLISSTGENNYFFLWIGDKAIAEYMYNNSNLNNKVTQTPMYFEKGVYYFVRIQVYTYIQPESFMNQYYTLPSFMFDCLPTSSMASNSPTSSPSMSPSMSPNIFNAPVFFSSQSPSSSTAPSSSTSGRLYSLLPTLLYTSFVSTSPQTYSLGEFQCFTQFDGSTTINYSELIKMYQILEAFKFSITNGIYDTYNGQDQYGKLPNGIYYTPTKDGPSSLPEVFYLYRLTGDVRMGNTYQIDTIKNKQNQFEMINVPKKFLAKSNDFTLYSDYYPTKTQVVNALDTSELQDGDPRQCVELCSNDPSCNFFYSFALNNSSDTQAQKCYLDSGIDTPSFNQINPNISQTENIQPGSSNLYIRNQDFSNAVKTICKATGEEKSVDIQIQNLKQTASYGTSFPYSNYYINNSVVITDPIDIEICANKKKIQKFNDCFDEILQKDMTYNSDGDIVSGDTVCTFLQEGFQNDLTTNAIQNTQQQGIDYINQQKQDFDSNMDSISNNYNEITNEIIPTYETSLKEVNESGYSQLQDKKLTYIGPVQLNAVQQSIKDNNERFVNMNLMFILAILTVVILIVFIYTMD